MIFRKYDNTLVIIERKNYLNDIEYYNEILRTLFKDCDISNPSTYHKEAILKYMSQ